MIRGTMAFGVCDPVGAELYFDSIISNGFQSLVPGPGGNGTGVFDWFGPANATRIFDAQTFWCVGFNFQPRNTGSNTAWAQDSFFQFRNAGGCILSLQIEITGKISVTYGGDGTTGTGATQGTTSQTFPVFAWSGYLEFKAFGFGGTVTWELWLDDVKILNGTTSTFPTQIPDRAMFTSQNGTTGGVHLVPGFGMVYTNVYILDAQGPAPWSDRLGPVRIATTSPVSDAQGNWNSTVAGAGTSPPIYTSITDLVGDAFGSPDQDHSYIFPVALNTNQLFVFASPACFGRILGVNVNQCFRGTTGSTTCDAMLLDPAILNIGTSVINGGYHIAQQFIGLSPASGSWFTAAEIGGSLWGARTTSPGLRLTQMFLEIITSLRATPFDCGASSYSF